MTRLQLLWSNLRSSFWFVPALTFAASIALAIGLIEIDSGQARPWIERWPRVFGSGAAGARTMLSTIAGSMMTVVGVTFSMTLVTLALASSQYTSRILRNFMADRITQVALGVFGGIFIYCLIVLRTIRGGDEDYVPSLAVVFGVVLASRRDRHPDLFHPSHRHRNPGFQHHRIRGERDAVLDRSSVSTTERGRRMQ